MNPYFMATKWHYQSMLEVTLYPCQASLTGTIFNVSSNVLALHNTRTFPI
jgi:hypothetical protein